MRLPRDVAGWWVPVVLLLAAGCGEDGENPGDSVRDVVLSVRADTLQVSGWALLGDTVRVRVVGRAGDTSCYRLERVDAYTVGRTCRIQPYVRHLVRSGLTCEPGGALYEGRLGIVPPDTGRWFFRVPSATDTLEATARVLLENVLAASLDDLMLPPWCRMAEGIAVRLIGNAGPFTTYRVDRIEIERDERTYTLRPFVQLLPDAPWKDAPSFDTTFTVWTPEKGPWWFRVIAANGSFVDSTKVN
jgi:hypothetical protein